MFVVKRVYDPASAGDGYRVLVDRLWPRGVSKERAGLDEWLKEVAPSPGLRRWFGHEAANFAEFTARYDFELAENPAVDRLRALGREHPTVTLLIGARDPVINHGVVLAAFLAR
ncbi:DUF488 domain-containing protein [Leifsonia poae]|uniref:DUF488 domain-containing protein n=1 Tax=Leifsonia poae TaxID=110933 RepID=UPI001CC0B476|nr:DUF488 family protein [Leifsonia poae]